jgi:hypothetical protein
MATLDAVTEKFREAVSGGNDLGKTLKFDLKGEGVVFIDGATVTNDDSPADLTLTTATSDLVDLSSSCRIWAWRCSFSPSCRACSASCAERVIDLSGLGS